VPASGVAGRQEWYVRATLQYGWSRDVLVHQIESGLRRRQSGAITNFDRVLPPAQSDPARQIAKDPYNFEFAGKMNFYLSAVSAVNDQLRHPDDQPGIGLILCKTRDRIIAEYALRDSKPIGISECHESELSGGTGR
jgi:hypothetical protein